MSDNLKYNIICTHSGCFHCDEVTATAMLSYLYGDIPIVRTRDADVVERYQNDPTAIVIDVGHVYDHGKQCYDHHQTTFDESLVPSLPMAIHIPLSSCGLIYRHYGMKLIQKMIKNEFQGVKFTDDQLVEIYDDFYKFFVLSIDAGDNGIDYTDGVKKYNPVILPETISHFNYVNVNDNDKQGVQFWIAVMYCRQTFLIHLKGAIQRKYTYYNGLTHFTAGLNSTPEYLKDQGILILEHIIPVEQYLKLNDPDQHYKFIIVKSHTGTYKLMTVNVKGKRFEILKKLISEQAAKDLVGAENLVFIHKAGFTGEAITLPAAIAICELSTKH